MRTGIPNHLAGSSSPYLLQHAFNPVDWYPWGPEALEKAKRENKLLIISIGYSACHWCHVMEHESFEDHEVAEVMNRSFVSVKIDREERPDIDHVYMNAAYIVTGRGGWPLNVIALPDERPVYAGTYFPRSEWIRVLNFFGDTYQNNPERLQQQAAEISAELKKTRRIPGFRESIEKKTEHLDKIFLRMKTDFDSEHGGTIGAPKFPMPGNLSFLLKYAFLTNNPHVVDHLRLTLDKMASGGIFDHTGGGFCRYSVDPWWHVPHFEKMLYDNAQLISLYADSFRFFREPSYAWILHRTMEFIIREMTSPEGLFYSALDADSEGEEGIFYTWRFEEFRNLFGPKAEEVADRLGINPDGNWEDGKNVIRLKELAGVLDPGLNEILDTLHRSRSKRIRPATDDKILTSWNAMMIKALCDAWRATGSERYLEMARRAGQFYLGMTERHESNVFRIYKEGVVTIPGFLDDYAFLASAFLELYENTFDQEWLKAAEDLVKRMLELFSEPGSLFFLYASTAETPLVQTTVELTDQVIPSSNSEAARVLYRLGHILDKQQYIIRGEEMLRAMYHEMMRNPSFHANWLLLLTDFLVSPFEIYIVGDDFTEKLAFLNKQYLPHCIFSGGRRDDFPGPLRGKYIPGRTSLYLCREKTCSVPEIDPEAILGKVQIFP